MVESKHHDFGIKGIKFVINGKIKGKTRSTSNSISFGKVPTQSVSKNIDYSKIHVFTIYGVFGFKL
jgi:ribosomal protein S3